MAPVRQELMKPRTPQFTMTRDGPTGAALGALRAVLTASAEELVAKGGAAFSAGSTPAQEALLYQVSSQRILCCFLYCSGSCRFW